MYTFIDALSTTADVNDRRLLSSDESSRNLQGTPVSEIIKCDFPGMCPDGTYKDSCKWERIFYVYVNNEASREIIVVTNSLPDHCYYVDSNPPIGVDYITNPATQSNTYQFKMKFNLPVSEMYQFRNQDSGPYVYSKLEDQTALDIFQCNSDWATSSSIDKAIGYDELTNPTYNPGNFISNTWDVSTTTPYLKLAEPDSIIGIALNGVFLFTPMSEFGYDAFYPVKYGNKLNPTPVNADICLGSVYQSTYKYHMFSPCILPSNLKSVSAPCDSACKKDIAKHSISRIPSQS